MPAGSRARWTTSRIDWAFRRRPWLGLCVLDRGAVHHLLPQLEPHPPRQAFPKLAFPATAAPGSSVALTFYVPSGMKAEDLFAAIYTGTGTECAKISSPKQVTVPADLRGTVRGHHHQWHRVR